jgi:hypothetical protein
MPSRKKIASLPKNDIKHTQLMGMLIFAKCFLLEGIDDMFVIAWVDLIL